MDFNTLVEKAARTDELTYVEGWLVSHGTAYWMETGNKEMLDVIRWPADIRDKYLLALDVIQTETDRKARKNGNIAVERYQQFLEERRNQISVDDRKNTRWRWKIQWVKDPTLDNAMLNDLCQYFQQLRDKNKIEPGLRYDTFLYANQAAIQSSLDHFPLPERGFVMTADPSHSLSKLPFTRTGSSAKSLSL
ncbi:hypothetical protein EYZ11_011111 [Aspergillus tanneri]|uniref:Uncharacterized protein n=1 Tax=Aspergillus tanneri TaxID=1220188 RepID=A0A4S3J5S4_9EURO|nr:hypothetical protein EYZ11_011111 [Aspergillus tanneri]